MSVEKGVHDVKNRDLREEVGRKRGNARGNQRRKKIRLDEDYGEEFEICQRREGEWMEWEGESDQ